MTQAETSLSFEVAGSWQEIAQADLAAHRLELLEVLEAVCQSAAFRSSAKSCTFLRHVVLRTLDCDVLSLKERLIGIALMGRDACYDTSADAVVRVRANDVRKRLIAWNRGSENQRRFTFVLRAGTYIPAVLRRADSPELEPELPEMPCLPPTSRRLSLSQITMPTVAALFLCLIGVRWQIAQQHFFTSFWQQVLIGRKALLYLPPISAASGGDLVGIQGLNEAAPLLDLAGEFHHSLTVVTANDTSGFDQGVLFYIGSGQAAGSGELASPNGKEGSPGRRFFIENTSGGRVVVDRNSLDHDHAVYRSAALLTIVNGTLRTVFIDGTDDQAVSRLVKRLCQETTFPDGLAEDLQPGTVTQALFLVDGQTRIAVARTSPTGLRASLESLP